VVADAQDSVEIILPAELGVGSVTVPLFAAAQLMNPFHVDNQAIIKACADIPIDSIEAILDGLATVAGDTAITINAETCTSIKTSALPTPAHAQLPRDLVDVDLTNDGDNAANRDVIVDNVKAFVRGKPRRMKFTRDFLLKLIQKF